MLDLDWPYKRHTVLFAGTQQYAQEQGWESIIDEFAYDTLPQRRTNSMPYDGIIARAPKRLAERANRLDVPVVNVWYSSPARDLLPGVFADFTAAGRIRAEHLLARGFRKFASLVSWTGRGEQLENKEFQRVVNEAGYPCVGAHIPLRVSSSLARWKKTEETISGWMDRWEPPVGVYIGSDRVGRTVVQMCHKRGWRVPEDIAIIAGANEESICENPGPSLSSIELGYDRIGYEAARLLDELMDETERQLRSQQTGSRTKQTAIAPRCVMLPPQGLVVRESTDFFAVSDSLVAAALEFIAAQSHKSIGPSDVARAVATELRTLQRRFRKSLDRPIATEIRRVRIERAKRELTQTDRPIGAISRDVGFGDPMRMYEIFTRELGVTPSHYRKQRTSQGDS